MQFYRPALPVPADALRRRNVSFALSAWQAGLRPDQREAAQLREASITFPLLTRDVVQVRLGATQVMATVACELVEPLPQRPKFGFFEIRVRQLLHERDDLQAPKRLRHLGGFLEKLFKGNVLEPEGLCVLPGRRVWSVAVEVVVVNDEGNVRDAAAWAVLAVLQHVRRPELTIRGEQIVVHPPQERDPVPLALHHLPVCCSFAITADPQAAALERRAAALGVPIRPINTSSNNSNDAQGQGEGLLTHSRPTATPSNTQPNSHNNNNISSIDAGLEIVVDPTLDEASAAASAVTVAVNAEGQVCALEKAEGCQLPWAYLQRCMHIAAQLSPQVLELMKQAMATHDKRREAALRGQFLWAQKRSGVTSAATNAAAADVQKSTTSEAVKAEEAKEEEEDTGKKKARLE